VAQGDEQRWRDSGTVAEQLLGDDATPDQVWSMTRVIFNDRETYPS
jgi:hypothetical protein